MKLQLALDHPDLTRELDIAARTVKYVDFIEAGTPLLIREGIRVVRELRRRCRCPVVADIKVVDAGEPIAELAFAAGAKVVTVETDGKTLEIEADEILAAVGRQPNITGLDLEKAGVEFDKNRRSMKR